MTSSSGGDVFIMIVIKYCVGGVVAVSFSHVSDVIMSTCARRPLRRGVGDDD